MADQPVIIIRRKKKGGGHGGHHGGAWKVAYADFVTAMMSFFLLLWLLNVTTDIERKGIADYFAPASISKSESGAGGVFGGQTITAEGAQISQNTPPSVENETVPTVGQGEQGDEDTKGKSENPADGKLTEGKNGFEAGNAQGKPNPDGKPGTAAMPAGVSEETAAMAAAMQREEDAFKQAEETLKQAITQSPELKEFAENIAIDRTNEGLRIQIIDRDKFSMFPSGGAVPYERGRDLLRLIGRVISRLPNNVSVTGHTDSNPFSANSRRDNWSLSTARANESRSEIMEGGVEEKRIQRVVGVADRDPYIPGDPKDPRNRRISIVLMRQALAPAELQQAGGGGGAKAPVTPAAPNEPAIAPDLMNLPRK